MTLNYVRVCDTYVVYLIVLRNIAYVSLKIIANIQKRPERLTIRTTLWTIRYHKERDLFRIIISNFSYLLNKTCTFQNTKPSDPLNS